MLGSYVGAARRFTEFFCLARAVGNHLAEELETHPRLAFALVNREHVERELRQRLDRSVPLPAPNSPAS
jgi:hypothetical protein